MSNCVLYQIRSKNGPGLCGEWRTTPLTVPEKSAVQWEIQVHIWQAAFEFRCFRNSMADIETHSA